MKRLLLIPGILSVALCMNAQQNAVEVNGLLDNERYSSAEDLLERKIVEKGADPDLGYLLVKTYLEQEKIEEARKIVEQYRLDDFRNLTDPMNQVTYGNYLLHTGKKEEAFSLFGELLNKKNKKDPALLIAIAEAHIEAEEGDITKALELLDIAGKRDKRNADVDIMKGNAYRKTGDASNAYLAYQSAIQKEPSCVKAHYLLGKIFVGQKNPDVYMEHFEKAYEMDSTYAPVLEALYDHYYFRDVKKAKRYLEKFIVNSDHSIRNEYSMADMLYLNGKYREAIATADAIIKKEEGKAQPRLFKLIAYSSAGIGDSANAAQRLEEYFEREHPAKLIAADYDFRAKLALRLSGDTLKGTGYYIKAFELDSVNANKLKYAIEIAGLYKVLRDYSNQAKWLAAAYRLKERKSNVDLFNWGLAHYNAREYVQADTIFGKYVAEYPDNIYGYYWRAQVNAAIDTSLSEGLAVPYYQKMIEIGERDKAANKKMLMKAYGYLGGYEANTQKNYPASMAWFEKLLQLDPESADAKRYIEILKAWIAEGK